jgi:TRAP-type C4-dicarboxylate transport system permease large subunit
LLKEYPTPWFPGAGVIACGGGVAILIPPSITLILFGILTEESIVKLFLAGFVPGFLLAVSDAIVIVFAAWYLKLPAGKFDLGFLGRAVWQAWPALYLMVKLVF